MILYTVRGSTISQSVENLALEQAVDLSCGINE